MDGNQREGENKRKSESWRGGVAGEIKKGNMTRTSMHFGGEASENTGESRNKK